jgi:hypothetical protein
MNFWKALLAVSAVCWITCGCKMVSGVKSSTEAIDGNRQAIEESTAGVKAIGQAITNSLPPLEAARRHIEVAAQAIAAAGPPIAATTVAVEQVRTAIEQSGASLEDIGELLSRSSQSIEEARRRIEESSQGIEANRIAIEASTRSIRENEATVNQSTAALTRIGGVLRDILDAWDRLPAKRSLFWVLLAGGMGLILAPWLVFLVTLRKLYHFDSDRGGLPRRLGQSGFTGEPGPNESSS